MRKITDADRQLFTGLSDRQIAAILAQEPRLEQDQEQEQDEQLIAYNARILRVFGYKGLCDYLDTTTGTHKLTAKDYDDLLNAAEKMRYSEFASLLSTIIAAPDALSSQSQRSKRETIDKIMEPLED